MTFRLTPRGPFDLQRANEHFGGWAGAGGEGEAFTIPMAFPLEDASGSAAVLVRQEAGGDVTGDVHGVADDAARAAWEQALAVLSLDVEGSGWPDVGRRDPVIGGLQERFAGLRPVLFHSPYEAACAFIIGHRISITQGRAIRRRMAEELGESIETPLGVQHAFPRPQRLLVVESFHGIAAAKWPRLHAVAKRALDGTLERAHLRGLNEDEALAELREIPGLGPFFSLGVLLRGAGVVDAVSEDRVTLECVRVAYELDHTPDVSEVGRISEAWRPYRMWANVLLHVGYRDSTRAE